MMDAKEGSAYNSNSNIINNNIIQSTDDDIEGFRRGPWTMEEDFTLMNYIAKHGEGRWNSLARCAGLRRTGKSCRLRWLNYLRPDVKRGNITLEEQLMILELHSQWGNRWSKIAQHLPGRTDNEIKNYWRTRVQKHAKQLKCDVNSKQFKDTMRYLWMPRLVERIQASAASAAAATTTPQQQQQQQLMPQPLSVSDYKSTHAQVMTPNYTSENSSTGASSDSIGTQVSNVSELSEYYTIPFSGNSDNTTNQDLLEGATANMRFGDNMNSPSGFLVNHGFDIPSMEQNNSWIDNGETLNNLWGVEDYLFFQQLNNNCM